MCVFFNFVGVGMGMVVVSAIVCIYYNVIVAWTIYYLFMSFRTTLPWSHCGNSWNTENCVDGIGNTFLLNGTNATGGTNMSFAKNLTKITASEEFWE